ncbi:hypothetical protein C8T65DRAFT_645647 [Cerioporus squamosus]|nr:hypothetical protein C8T65DRAFT_645647 [Cerioporus squamosus]
MVKAVFQLPNIKSVAGRAGTMGEVKVKKFGVEYDEFINNIGLPANFPSSVVVTVSSFLRCCLACALVGLYGVLPVRCVGDRSLVVCAMSVSVELSCCTPFL